MSTDSTRISETAQTEAEITLLRRLVRKYIYGTEKAKETKKSKAQDAHEAIRPTSVHEKARGIKRVS